MRTNGNGGTKRASKSKRAKGTVAARPTRPADRNFWGLFQPEARISARTFLGGGQRHLAEPNPIFLRPQDDPTDDDWPDPDEPGNDDPCAGRPNVRPPLVAAQVNLQFGVTPEPCPTDADVERIKQAVRSQFSPLIPNADVRVRCADRLLTIAVWPSWNTANSCEGEARERGLNRLDLIDELETFGFFLNRALIGEQAQRAFAVAPKQLSTNGAPSPFGPIHLTGLSVRFEAPDKVKTLVTGYDDRPWPDVGFTLTITDLIQGGLTCTTTDDLDTHGAWKAVLGAILLGGASIFLPLLLPVTFFVVFNDLDAAINQPSGGTGDSEGGVGCRTLGLVPVEVPLPNGRKLGVAYRRSEVTTGGLFFGGTAVPGMRQPAASIAGPAQLVVAENMPATFATFEVRTNDTFGTLTVTWASTPGVTVERPSARRTKISFSRGNRTADSPPFTRTIRATVMDQDGFVQTVEHEVEIFVMETESLPPVCRVRPWLPQCQEPLVPA
jgi:hypothetical protein